VLGNHWKNYRQGCIDAGREVDPANWRVVRTVLVAPTDEEARARAFSAQGSQRYFFNHFFKVFSRARQLDAVRPRPGVADQDITLEDIIESRLIYGSPQTVAGRLAALRKTAGPFGTLLISGMDWSGPNADWERESLTLLAHEVMPLLRKQIAVDEAAQV
jgi:alkanesulfonate monooxygenase SsuD/methylene tetrahydromethanopterin reductase-like flavin-dependent oxidoreductase (luciferase family)